MHLQNTNLKSDLGHLSQEKAFSPVWVLLCTSSENDLVHYSQWHRFPAVRVDLRWSKTLEKKCMSLQMLGFGR